LEWVSRHENLVVCGPSGTGKSHLLEALGYAAIEAGHHVSWFSLEDLGALLHRHRADGTVARAVRRLMNAELIVIDLCRPGDYADRWARVSATALW
jgi:DNA replication protein DnaC